MSNTNCSVCKGTGVYVPGNLKTCPSCHSADEQETIYDRDVRAVVAAWVSDPNFGAKDVASIQNMIRICEMIASEMQTQRKQRKASNNE